MFRGGACPTLTSGVNHIRSGGADREFILLFPETVAADEVLPVVFFWHWLGGSANSFVRRGELELAVEEQRFIAVIPEDKDDLLFRWPFSALDSDARLEEELGFFDDLLACVHEALPVNEQCVISAGVSAGALWTSQLAIHRSQYLSSMISLSGGTGTGSIRPWSAPEHRLPALVLWGGPSDICVVLNFQDLSNDLSGNLERDGHFMIECVHNCGHAVPPVDPSEEMSLFAPFWEFGFNHPYWLRDGESPYQAMDRLPAHFPSWCSMGRGTASPRSGSCDDSSGC
jgi:predicted esterase